MPPLYQRTLALDPATKCGWALQDGKQIISGVWDLSTHRYEGGGMRYVRLKKYLRDIGPVDLLTFEEVASHKGTAAAHVYGGIVATITGWCEEQLIPYQGIPVATIKKHATGKGNANKEKMCEAFKARNGRDPIDDNEADAWWLLDYTLKELV
ncbi:hypothetical protein C4571_02080 [Candidatus Parcubacteria bacterium]|nr:MAG: hypothetical protein C4571_02080 [Candidatus Parcubacteria bacterium]